MICSQCQAMNEHDSMFCANCGTSLTRSVPGPARPGSPQQSTILADLGRGMPSTQGAYYAPGGPAGQYAPGAPPGQYAPGAPGNNYSPDAAPGPYEPSTPTSQYTPADPARSYSADSPGNYYPPGTHGRYPQPGLPGSEHTFNLDLRRLSRVDRTVGGASLIVLISLFLPWFGVDGLGISGTSMHGYLVIAVILAVLLIAYLVLRAGWDEFPVTLPVAHAPLLLIGTGLQFLLVIIGFFDKPALLSWEIGAYLGLIAAAAAAGPVIIPAIRSWQATR